MSESPAPAALSQRTWNTLCRHACSYGVEPDHAVHGVDRIADYCRQQADEDLLKIRNFGEVSLAEVRAWLGPPAPDDIVANWVGEGGPTTAPQDPPPPPPVPEPREPRGYLTRLRAVRKAQGLSLKDLMQVSGFPMATLIRWEWLEQRAGTKSIGRLAVALGVEPGDLLGPATTPRSEER